MTHRTENEQNTTNVAPKPRRILFIIAVAALLLFSVRASAQVAPYITDVAGEPNVEYSPVKGKTESGALRLLGTFKLFNPDTMPFYIWVSFENGGRLTHSRRGHDSPTIRLVNIELRYRDASHRPIVKEFSENDAAVPRIRPRMGWTASRSGSASRFGRKKSHVDQSGEDAASSVRRRSRGAVEIVFWQEDVQAYYEMELWGVLYAPDLKKAVVAGNYVENIKFEIEPAAR